MRSYRFPVLLALLLSAGFASGTSVRLLNLPEMVRLADRVFVGVCLSVEEKSAESFSLPIVEYVFEVRQGIKGVQSGEKIVFRQVQSGQNGVAGIPGIPSYQKGQEVLLFLHADSRLGLTSPVGLSQGVFQLEKTRDGEVGVLNALENVNLRYQMTVATAQESGISGVDFNFLEKGKPIPIEIFSSLVRKIDRDYTSKGKSPQ
ncbi:hypothetical protein MYX82_14470 [Acidobacteria bacterium AH-259-D05]|nr:hypothetical protein [Acidobacteria bacterium AH-259-D05]